MTNQFKTATYRPSVFNDLLAEALGVQVMILCFIVGVVFLIISGCLLNDAIKNNCVIKALNFGTALIAGCYFITAMVGHAS